MPSLATFNANNFFLRSKFRNRYPGDVSGKSEIEASAVAPMGYLSGLDFGEYSSAYIIWYESRRELAKQALMEPDGQLPDILCFQEVENIQAIRVLNEDYLDDFYPYSLLIDGYDTRNIDVGLLSRFPVLQVRSHIEDIEDDKRIFSRDCLEVTLDLDGEAITLFLNHLKSKFVRRKANESDADYNHRILESHQKRLNQATKAAEFVDERFEG